MTDKSSLPAQEQFRNQSDFRGLIFVNADDFETDYERMRSGGVKFLESPRV
ncbi:MAG: hypothetical protein RIF33_24570 [Cyclobacteriaceae bacterium]